MLWTSVEHELALVSHMSAFESRMGGRGVGHGCAKVLLMESHQGQSYNHAYWNLRCQGDLLNRGGLRGAAGDRSMRSAAIQKRMLQGFHPL